MNTLKKWTLLAITCSYIPHTVLGVFSIDPLIDTIQQLKDRNLIHDNQAIKLHLGCGQSYLQHYINIDFPLTDHTVQTYSVADVYADILQLLFPPNSIDEIRSHHIFEHFDRQTALALICAWHIWLKPGGTLIIETPDFEASIRVMLDARISYKNKQIALRHIFGSHEAHWAYHYDGWYKAKFEYVLHALGFSVMSCKLLHYNPLIPSIEVQAKKTVSVSLENLKHSSKDILRDSMVDDGDTGMWHVWCQAFDKALHTLHL